MRSKPCAIFRVCGCGVSIHSADRNPGLQSICHLCPQSPRKRRMEAVKPVEAAVLRTLLYADIFRFALTFDELHYFLIHNEPVTPEQVREALEISPRLRTLLCVSNGYVTLLENSGYIEER